jgi:hypothetical protein
MSNTKDTSGPAFPPSNPGYAQGMTLRDYFAAEAMRGVLEGRYPITEKPNAQEEIAFAAYKQADAMLKARQA